MSNSQHELVRTTGRVAQLERESRALRKTVDALMSRVERELNESTDGFAIFEAAVRLEDTVRQRTEQLERLNERLRHELEMRQQIEAALNTAKQQAEEANLIKTKFLAAASHDLRQPLSSAFLFLESLDESTLTAANLGFVRKTKIALSSLNDLLGSLLDITKLEVGGIEPRICSFRIEDLLEKIVAEYTRVAAAAGLDLDHTACSAVVSSDPRLLETVLRNFVSNAIRYTQSGRVLIGCRRRLQGLEIGVYDTGPGISSQELGKIFEAYHQCPSTPGKRRELGMGLGLSIVERITSSLGIERRVRSTPSKGSTFSVIVPYGGRPVRITTRPESYIKRARLGGKVIVVIDDNRDVLDGMSALLQKWDCIVVAARTGADAVVEILSRGLTPALIISDYHLADGCKGDETIREICREIGASPPAFVITSDPDPKLRANLRSAGIGVLAKPLNIAKLRAMIDQKLSRPSRSITTRAV